MELWKVIPEYQNYEASTLGNIRHTTTRKQLAPFYVQGGYVQVRLSLGSRKDYKVCRVHRLVASAWLPNPESKETVNHKNANKYDNRLANLEWLSHKEQAQHYVELMKEQGNVVRHKTTGEVSNDLEGEVWKVIPSLPKYKASTKGRIKNNKGFVLKGHSKTTYVQMRIEGGKHIYVHRVIAETFLENFTTESVVNHIDGNKHNNCSNNLECITQRENILHAYNTNALKRRIPVQQYDMNNQLIATYESFLEAARQTGFKDGSIRWAINHANGRHGGYIWKKSDT